MPWPWKTSLAHPEGLIMKQTRGRLLLAAALAGVACLGAQTEDAPKLSARVKERLGEGTIAVLARATQVEAFRIAPERDVKKGEKQIGGHRILATGKEQGQKFAAQLATVLLQE